MAQAPYKSISPLEFVRRMDYGEKFILLVDLFDIVTDFVFFASIDKDETLRFAVLICACLGVFAWVMKLLWLKGAIEHDYDAWDTTHGLVNFGYITLIVEDIPQIVFVILITASNDMPAIATMQLAFTCVACVWKGLQDLFLALDCLAIDLTGKRKTTGQMFVEQYCSCCITDFDPDNASTCCAPFYECCGIILITNYAEKQRAKNERDIEDGGASLPATPREQQTTKTIDVALLTSSPLVQNDQVITPQINPVLVKGRLSSFCTTALGNTERSFKFLHHTATTNNFQYACTGGAKVIHYSGQTVDGKLAFEMDPSIGVPGECLLIDGDLLGTYISNDSCKLAFVASSQPRFAGQVFVDAGVQHVVCIYSEESRDQACANTFTASFYLQLISGETVQKAYDIAITNVKNDPDYDEDNFLLISNGRASGHDVSIFDINEENSLEGFQDYSEIIPYNNLHVDDGLVLGREQMVADTIPAIMRFSVNAIAGPNQSNNEALMMATSNYLVDRYCFTKGVHYVNISPKKNDPYSYCLDLILAQEFKINMPERNDAGIVDETDGDQEIQIDYSHEVLAWLKDQESNDHVGLTKCLLLCFVGLRSVLVDTEFEESGFAFISQAVRNKNLRLLKDMIERSTGLRLLVCTSNRDVHQLLLDSGMHRVNPTTTQVRSVQPSESLHL